MGFDPVSYWAKKNQQSHKSGVPAAIVRKIPTPAYFGEKRLIYFYGNRKRYDPALKEYVNMMFILGLIKNGWDVIIMERRSKKDVTIDNVSRAFLKEWMRQFKTKKEFFEFIRNFSSSASSCE